MNQSNYNLIIDGNNLAYRCKYAYRLSYKGVDTSITFGFLKVLSSYVSKFKPSKVIVCWDSGVPEFRRKILPEYKANRVHNMEEGERDDFYRQMNELQDHALSLLGVCSITAQNLEADDLINAVSKSLPGKSLIVSSDADVVQCVNENVTVLQPQQDRVISLSNIKEIYGIEPDMFLIWKALQGDKSDNIPGIHNCGEKTAALVINTYGNLDNIFLNAPHLKKVGAAMAEFGPEGVMRNLRIMDLGETLAESKKVVEPYLTKVLSVDTLRVKRYLMQNGFFSLIEYVPAFERMSRWL